MVKDSIGDRGMNEQVEIITEQLIAARESYDHYKKLVLQLEKELQEALE